MNKPFTSKHCTPINYGSPLKKEDDKKPKQTFADIGHIEK